MKIVVCVKQSLGEINPYDASALEIALKVKDAQGAEVTVLSMGRPDVAEMLDDLLRRGADRAVLLTDQAFAGSDTLATAYTLSLAIRRLAPDLVVCGRQSVDSDTAQTGPCLAATLGWPQVTRILDISQADRQQVSCRTRSGIVRAGIPVLLTAECSNVLRFISIRPKQAVVEIWDSNSLNADLARCGTAGSPTRVIRYFASETGSRQCQFVSSSELMTIIRQASCRTQQAVLSSDPSVFERFREVWTIGDDIEDAAAIAEIVRKIPCQDVEDIVRLALAEQPDVILWKADDWGRDTAPRVAALLQTGLCADCTGLEIDGNHLIMIRPTNGGSMMARIESRTMPQMATIRTVDCISGDIIVAGGRGARHCFDLVEKLAGRLGALGASRSAVNLGLAPYEAQIGLTGRFISPMIYLACGISGAVQHTCAIEKAGTIIAINRDPDARIFEHADYGVVEDAAVAIENIFQFL